MAAQRFVSRPTGQRTHEFRKPIGAPGPAHEWMMYLCLRSPRLARIGRRCYAGGMSVSKQTFSALRPKMRREPTTRSSAWSVTQLRQTLELVRSAETMPWTDQLEIIRADNAFRYGKELCRLLRRPSYGTRSTAEMDRLYAAMNEGKEPDLGD